jgi:hypothetical protein
MAWIKNLPRVEGWYWTRWQDKNKEWRQTPARLEMFVDEGLFRVVDGGSIPIRKDVGWEELKKIFNFEELLVWDVPITCPRPQNAPEK